MMHVKNRHHRINTIEDYEIFIGAKSVERILKKAERVRDLHFVNANSTYYDGGVEEGAVVLQKSIREGFGFTVTEAMWKKTPVIGGNVEVSGI